MSDGGVLIVSLHADPSQPSGVGEGGGTHSYLRELAAGLALRGRLCSIITRRKLPTLEEKVAISPKTTLFRIDIGPPGPIDKRMLNSFHKQTKTAIWGILQQMRSPPILFHSVYWNSGRAVLDLSGETSIPYVHTVISNGKGRRLRGARDHCSDRERIERDVFLGAYRIFSISSCEKNDLMELYDIPGNKIVVIGRPVHAAYLQAAHDEIGQPRPFY